MHGLQLIIEHVYIKMAFESANDFQNHVPFLGTLEMLVVKVFIELLQN